MQSKSFAKEIYKGDIKGEVSDSAGTNGLGSEVVTYPVPPGLETSPDFTVRVSGTEVWTQRVGDGGLEDLNVARFALSK